MAVAVNYVHLEGTAYELRLTSSLAIELGISPKDYESICGDLARTNASVQKAIEGGETNVDLFDPQTPEARSKRNVLTRGVVIVPCQGANIMMSGGEARAAFQLEANALSYMNVSCVCSDLDVFFPAFSVWSLTGDGNYSSATGTGEWPMNSWECTLNISRSVTEVPVMCYVGFITDAAQPRNHAIFTYYIRQQTN